MRISDWSSDVCSSDLDATAAAHARRPVRRSADALAGSARVFAGRSIGLQRQPPGLGGAAATQADAAAGAPAAGHADGADDDVAAAAAVLDRKSTRLNSSH